MSLAAPEQSLSSRSGGLEEEEPAASSKELGDWLRQHPTYTMDMAAFTPVGLSTPSSRRRRGAASGLLTLTGLSSLVEQKSEDLLLSQFSKPKQKRHRCRNPNKIDINTLTGEERVPVVNRRNGRKVSAAAASSPSPDPGWRRSHRLRLPSDGRGHGSPHEGAAQVVTGQPRVFCGA